MNRRQAAAIAAVAMAATGIIAGAAMETPVALPEPVPVVETVGAPETEQRQGSERTVRVLVRLLAFLPSVGWVVLKGAGGMLAPLLTSILGCLSLFTLPLIILALAGRMAGLSPRQLLRPRSAVPLLGLTAVLAALSRILSGWIPGWVRVPGATVCLVIAGLWILRREREAQRRERASRAYIEETARRLADSVCPRRWK